MVKLVTTYCLILVSVYCCAQGQYTDRVSVSMSDGESYALYLPENYKAGEIAPILIVFAPDGVGKHGVAPFKIVADERGMIIVSSNDCRNGPYEENLGFAQRLFYHIFSQYVIDPNQIFLSGFSGGSRLASAIASLSGNIAGVVACGASFSENLGYRPKSDDGFVWLGIVGDRDFNYQEMLDSGFAWPIVDMRIKYVKPLTLHQKIRLTATLIEFENRLKIDYHIMDIETQEPLTKAHTIQVAVHIETQEMHFETPAAFRNSVQKALS